MGGGGAFWQGTYVGNVFMPDVVVRNKAAREIIQNTPEIFERLHQNLVCRCSVCNETGGRHFEQILSINWEEYH